MERIRIKLKQTKPGNLPYAVLYHGMNGYRFLVDTGSTDSWIDPQCLCMFLFENEVSYRKELINGETRQVFPSTLRTKPRNGTSDDYESPKFMANLTCHSLDNLREMNRHIEEPLHGILGMDFLRDNNIKVDLENLVLLA